MAQQFPADSEPTDTGELPMQPTGSGATDLEIAKLQAAVADGSPDPEIETGIVDNDAASKRETAPDLSGTTRTQA